MNDLEQKIPHLFIAFPADKRFCTAMGEQVKIVHHLRAEMDPQTFPRCAAEVIDPVRHARRDKDDRRLVDRNGVSVFKIHLRTVPLR